MAAGWPCGWELDTVGSSLERNLQELDSSHPCLPLGVFGPAIWLLCASTSSPASWHFPMGGLVGIPALTGFICSIQHGLATFRGSSEGHSQQDRKCEA